MRYGLMKKIPLIKPTGGVFLWKKRKIFQGLLGRFTSVTVHIMQLKER